MVGVSASAQASVGGPRATDYIVNDGVPLGSVATDGVVNHPATIELNGDTYTPIDHATANGHSVYQYRMSGTNLCLQDDLNAQEVVQGTCATGNARQQWWYDNATLLENISGISNGHGCAAAVTFGADVVMQACQSNDGAQEWQIGPDEVR